MRFRFLTPLAPVNGREFNFIIPEDAGDLMGTVALHAQMKNAPHHSGGFFIQGPVVLVLWGFPIQ